MILTLEEARSYAHDHESPDEDILALIDVVESMIEDGVRAGFDRSSPQAKMLARLYVADLTDDRGVTAAQASARRYLVSSLILQLRCKDPAAEASAESAPVSDSDTGAAEEG